MATIHLLVFDGFADWEPALALATARQHCGAAVETIGLEARPVRSMAGLTILPDRPLAAVRPAESALLVLPGGEMWEEAEQPAVTAAIHAWLAAGVPVAGICGATIALARAGVLDERRHTSNAPGYLDAHAPAYRGTARYRDDALAVTEGGVITAAGTAPVEFAREILGLLKLAEGEAADWFFRTYKEGRPPYWPPPAVAAQG